MNCQGKVKQTCGVKVYAPCVSYEKIVPQYSALYNQGCLTIEDTTGDLYNQVGIIKDDISISTLGQLCLTYVPNGQVAKVKDVLIKYEQEICQLKEQVKTLQETAICNMDITNCGLDLSGIDDQCDNPVKTLADLLQYFINNQP